MKRDPIKSKQRIIEAATEHFALYGMAGTRVDEIAKSAGINNAMIYHYYKNKKSLYHEVLKQQMKNMHESINLDQSLDEKEIIKQAISGYFDFCYHHPFYVSLMMWEMVEDWKNLNELSEKIQHEINELLVEKVTQGIEKGYFYQDIDPRMFVSGAILQVFCSFSLFKHLNLLNKGPGISPDSKDIERYKNKLTIQILRSIMVKDDNEGNHHGATD
ncbi:TetR/AcrR family transcriptional regulator [Oceanobacillus jeddahense]|uniref:TetR/AcrR family transcriptional regulator n=1 Tax=Oceanobacillus jeddahense TaxID=1462527 RepID=A0ABY5JMR3_9BACI|nr:TetR/AcrR family transcriptional regulator [Oceanobacillus jeddahense]UUI01105.1 TetR/AcrR family transcriptional regulator [Oceanobacillus jeddahense]